MTATLTLSMGSEARSQNTEQEPLRRVVGLVWSGGEVGKFGADRGSRGSVSGVSRASRVSRLGRVQRVER